MPAPKGHPKWGGIKKGSKHKRTLAEEACARAGICPFDLLVSGAVNGDMGAIIQLCKHIEPVRKPIEVAVDPEKSTITVRVIDYGIKDSSSA